jgi:N-acetylglutamate synthase-like GNAT family acetyltransferase
MPGSIQFHIEYNPVCDGLQFLEQSIYDYNRAQTGKNGGKTFAIYHRNGNNEILAGVHGWVWAKSCEIRGIWVHPALRGQGIGRRLLEMAEQEASDHGCQAITLKVYSFQSPEFYARLGYQTVACLDDFPPGYQTHYLVKRLREEASSVTSQ